MADFRRVILALAVLSLFAGLASADVIGTQPQLTCSTNVAVTPALRGEGFTEQTGDVTISCTGGTAPVAGAVVPLVNFVVYYNSNVTSRLFASSGTSEALLLIDEPGSGLQGAPGDGPNQAQYVCATPFTGCPSWVNVPATGPAYSATAPAAGSPRAPNVYQGIVSGNSVTFFGVPVLPPTTTGSRVFRITNVRINAQPLSPASGAAAVQASVSTSPAGALTITQPFLNVGFVSPSLKAGADSIGSLNQCASQTKVAVSTISFAEQFGTAFKTRMNPGAVDNPYVGQLFTPGNDPASALRLSTQAIPGAIYNSESNLVIPIGGNFAGLADYGTRLKATFSNIPTGARIFVSQANVNNATTPGSLPVIVAANGTTTAGAIGGISQSSYARLVSSDSVLDSIGAAGVLPSLDTSATTTSGTVTISEIPISNGTGTATWEVLNTNPNSNETFKFGVYVTYTANTANNIPLPGDSSVTLSYAPNATSGVATTGVLPRFAPGSPAIKIFTIAICRTILLYPYLTNQQGFDTGITVANTTVDPFGTAAQAGNCKLNWYGGTTAAPTTPPAVTDTGVVQPGTVWAQTLGGLGPVATFQGYMIAVCNFQLAHGFAFISDVGARNIAMGYLAVVLTDGRAIANTTTAENGGH
jgi:hypothetical protein